MRLHLTNGRLVSIALSVTPTGLLPPTRSSVHLKYCREWFITTPTHVARSKLRNTTYLLLICKLFFSFPISHKIRWHKFYMPIIGCMTTWWQNFASGRHLSVRRAHCVSRSTPQEAKWHSAISSRTRTSATWALYNIFVYYYYFSIILYCTLYTICRLFPIENFHSERTNRSAGE